MVVLLAITPAGASAMTVGDARAAVRAWAAALSRATDHPVRVQVASCATRGRMQARCKAVIVFRRTGTRCSTVLEVRQRRGTPRATARDVRSSPFRCANPRPR
jgi:hypothetical protein